MSLSKLQTKFKLWQNAATQIKLTLAIYDIRDKVANINDRFQF
jgi:hypothetical protein